MTGGCEGATIHHCDCSNSTNITIAVERQVDETLDMPWLQWLLKSHLMLRLTLSNVLYSH